MILAMAIDPLSQQALRYYNCWTLDPGQRASVPVYHSHVLDPTSRKVSHGQSEGEAAILEGLIGDRNNESTVSPVVPKCPSGRCNFTQSYSSLGFRSSCHNVVYDLTAALVARPREKSEGPDQRLVFDHPLFTRIIDDFADNNHTVWQFDTALRVVSEHAVFLPDATERGPYTAYNGHVAVVDSLNNPVPPERLQPYSVTTNGPPIGYTMYVAPTFDLNCTFDWMHGGEKQPTDCVASSMIADSTAKGFFDAVDPVNPQWTLPELSDYPNVTSGLCSVSYCVKTYDAKVQNGLLTESILNESAVIAVADRRAGSPKVSSYIMNIPGRTSWFVTEGEKPWDLVQLIASPCILGNTTYDLSDFIDIAEAEQNGFLPSKYADDSLAFTTLASSGNFTGLRNSLEEGSRNRTILVTRRRSNMVGWWR